MPGASVATVRATTTNRAGLRSAWVFSPSADLILSLSWVPVFLAWHVLAGGTSATAATRAQQGVALALLLSFLHQPLTLGLVYGDSRQLSQHRRLFYWAPMAAVVVAVVAAMRNWWIVIPVAAVWNLQHTLQQRYGVQRMYSGRSGYGSARLDRAMAYVPMAAVLSAVAASPSLTGLVQRANLDNRNAGGVRLLADIRPAATALAVIALGASLVVVGLVVAQERRAGEKANPAKWMYQASQLALVGSIVVDPTAGFIAYVTAHAVEYGVIVERTAQRRYRPGPDPQPTGLLPVLGRSAVGRVGYFVAILGMALVGKVELHGSALNALLLSVGALHFTYDAVIWKLRRPALARELRLAG